MIELPRVAAVELRRELLTGATRPCVMACRDADGNPCGDYVVKFRSQVRGGRTGLAFEFLAAQLALRLSIPIPAPALVEISEGLSEAMPDQDTAERLRESRGTSAPAL